MSSYRNSKDINMYLDAKKKTKKMKFYNSLNYYNHLPVSVTKQYFTKHFSAPNKETKIFKGQFFLKETS